MDGLFIFGLVIRSLPRRLILCFCLFRFIITFGLPPVRDGLGTSESFLFFVIGSVLPLFPSICH